MRISHQDIFVFWRIGKRKPLFFSGYIIIIQQ